MTKRKKTAKGKEWIGGVVRLPAYMHDSEAGPYRPELLIWAHGDLFLGSKVFRPGEALEHVVAHLRETAAAPLIGPAGLPARVRMEDPVLAEHLRRALEPEVEIVCGPTPDLHALAQVLAARLEEDDAEDASYLGHDLTPEVMGSFFRTAARLYRVRPWDVVPDDTSLVEIELEGRDPAVLSVIGQAGESFGVVLFTSEAAFWAFAESADELEGGGEPEVPAHLALNFERAAEMPPSLPREIAAHGWEVEGPDATPWVTVTDDDGIMRGATLEELATVQAIAGALAELIETEDLTRAWSDAAVERTFAVETCAGARSITLRTRAEGPFDVHASILDETSGLDEDAAERYLRRLTKLFATSERARALTDPGDWAHTIQDYAASYFGATAAALRPKDLEEIVFDLLPRKMVVEATRAGEIIDELRAFFTFVAEDLGVAPAAHCAALLDARAARRLEAALSDPSNFGVAKSLVMQGAAEGFDVSSEEGLSAWMAEAQRRPVLAPGLAPRGPRPAPQAKRAKRKAARKARKKNR